MTDDFMKPRSGCDKILERELRDLWEPVLDNWCIADAVHPVSQAPEAENGYLNGTGLPRSRILGIDGEVVITEAGRFRLGKVLDNYEFHWPDARRRVLNFYRLCSVCEHMSPKKKAAPEGAACDSQTGLATRHK